MDGSFISIYELISHLGNVFCVITYTYEFYYYYIAYLHTQYIPSTNVYTMPTSSHNVGIGDLSPSHARGQLHSLKILLVSPHALGINLSFYLIMFVDFETITCTYFEGEL